MPQRRVTTESLMQTVCDDINGNGPKILKVGNGPIFAAVWCCDDSRATALVRAAGLILRERRKKYDTHKLEVIHAATRG